MDAFENLVAMLLRREGYWTDTSFKVELTKKEKREIGRPTTPRWEIDVIAYSGDRNELLAVECKSFLASRGVQFQRGFLHPRDRYKVFTDTALRKALRRRLRKQLNSAGLTPQNPSVRFCLAAGNVCNVATEASIKQEFRRRGWGFFGPQWIIERIEQAGSSAYENDVAWTVARILSRAHVRSV